MIIYLKKLIEYNQIMNIYLISQTENDGYDTYDSCVVVAENEDMARRITPVSTTYNSQYYDKSLDKNIPVVVKVLENGDFQDHDESEYCITDRDDPRFYDYLGSRYAIERWATNIANVEVTYLGILKDLTYKSGDIICSSYNAG